MKADAYGRVEENSYPSVHRVGAQSPSTPWAMHLTDDRGVFRFLCFDFDGKDRHGINVDLMESAQDDCDALSAILRELAIEHVVCQSSGSGGRHIWVALEHGAEASQVESLAIAARANFRTLDHGMLKNARTGAARPPLSPHRDGSRSTVLNGSLEWLVVPRTASGALTELARVLEERAPAMREADTVPSGPIDTGHTAHRELSRAGGAHMATIEGGGNPSWTGFMCLLSAASAGWTIADVQRAAASAPGMEHFRTKKNGRGGRRARARDEAQERLERQWDKAQRYAALRRPLPAIEPQLDLTELSAIVADVSALQERIEASPGRWGRTESAVSQRTILNALAYLTLHTGKRVVAASIRDLALMTALGRSTAAAALRALTDAGFIARASSSEGASAAEWRLSPTVSTEYGTVRSQPLITPAPPAELFASRRELLERLEKGLVDQRHDLFTRGGLGHTAGRIYSSLSGDLAMSVRELANRLGVSSRYVVTVLSRMRKHRLIRIGEVGWYRVKRDLRAKAAAVLGVTGVLKARAERYALEREMWQWWQAEVTTMSTPPSRRPRRPHVTSRSLQFAQPRSGERVWPRYPRGVDGRGDHREARYWVANGMLEPDSLWWIA